ncbi:MAG: hypothetical protein ACI8UP_002736, partial [Porticoccaceae bacterium]
RVTWMWSMVEQQILASVKNNPELEPLSASLELQVRKQSLTAPQAANELLVAWAQSRYLDAPAPIPTVP